VGRLALAKIRLFVKAKKGVNEMGIFGENKEKRALRYLEILEHVLSEHDRTFTSQIGYFYRDFKESQIYRDQFDSSPRPEEEDVSPKGIVRYRIMGLALVSAKFQSKRSDIEGFIQAASAITISKVPTIAEASKQEYIVDRETFNVLLKSKPSLVEQTQGIIEGNAELICEAHINAIGESLGQEFTENLINRKIIAEKSLPIAINIIGGMSNNWK